MAALPRSEILKHCELWPERIAERLKNADHHIVRLPEIFAPLGVEPGA